MTGSIFNFLFPIDGPSLIDGRFLQYLFGLVIPVQRVVKTQDEVKIRFSDYVLCLDLDFPATFHLPPAHTRRGKPLRFVDVGKKAARHHVTLRPVPHDRIFNWPTHDLVMISDNEIVTLWPFWDLEHHGWFVYPHPGGATTVSPRPPEDPAVGDSWWNENDGQLYIYAGPEVGWVAASCCEGGIAFGPRPPEKPLKGWLWYDTNASALKIWSGEEWLTIGGAGGGGTALTPRPPANPVPGQQWFSPQNQLYIWTGTAWVPAICAPCEDCERDEAGAIISAGPPPACVPGVLWFDGRELLVWTGDAWIPTFCCEGVSIGCEPPRNPARGALHWSENDGQLYLFTGQSWVPASCCNPADIAAAIGIFSTNDHGLVPAPGPGGVTGTDPTDHFLNSAGGWEVPGTNSHNLWTSYNILPTDDVVQFQGPSSGATILTLPSVSAVPAGKKIRLYDIGIWGPSVTIACQSPSWLIVMTPQSWSWIAAGGGLQIPSPGYKVSIEAITDGYDWYLVNTGIPFDAVAVAGTGVATRAPPEGITPLSTGPLRVAGTVGQGVPAVAAPVPSAAPTNYYLDSSNQWTIPGTNYQFLIATDYAILPTDDYVQYWTSSAMTLTLPPIGSLPNGKTLRIVQQGGAGSAVIACPTNSFYLMTSEGMMGFNPGNFAIPGVTGNTGRADLKIVATQNTYLIVNAGAPFPTTINQSPGSPIAIVVAGIVGASVSQTAAGLVPAGNAIVQAADDTTAAAAGVAIGGMYRNGSVLMMRVA